ncbi:MAG: transporter [Lachnospiraceae bacterium]|nr:transporter [Lachnospiraceae bacterium]
MNRIKNIILLQGVVIIYTLNSILAKFSSGKEVFSMGFFMFYGAEIAILGIYAILWQQMIKRFDLSVAYANRAMALLWSAVWAVVIFGEDISLKQLVGVAMVILGTVIVNTESGKEESKA